MRAFHPWNHTSLCGCFRALILKPKRFMDTLQPRHDVAKFSLAFAFCKKCSWERKSVIAALHNGSVLGFVQLPHFDPAMEYSPPVMTHLTTDRRLHIRWRAAVQCALIRHALPCLWGHRCFAKGGFIPHSWPSGGNGDPSTMGMPNHPNLPMSVRWEMIPSCLGVSKTGDSATIRFS